MIHQSNQDPDRLSKELQELLSGDASPEEFTKGLFFLTLEQTKASDPQLAEIMMACAIPRRLDAKIIGIIRDLPDDVATNALLLENLKSFSFVQSRTDGSFVYHDNTRDVVLTVWESDEYRERYGPMKAKLARFYMASGQDSHFREKLNEALEDMNSAVELRPEDGLNYFWRGLVHRKLKDYSAALADLSKAIELRPDEGNNYA